jgi:hypothetical protein
MRYINNLIDYNIIKDNNIIRKIKIIKRIRDNENKSVDNDNNK